MIIHKQITNASQTTNIIFSLLVDGALRANGQEYTEKNI